MGKRVCYRAWLVIFVKKMAFFYTCRSAPLLLHSLSVMNMARLIKATVSICMTTTTKGDHKGRPYGEIMESSVLGLACFITESFSMKRLSPNRERKLNKTSLQKT